MYRRSEPSYQDSWETQPNRKVSTNTTFSGTFYITEVGLVSCPYEGLIILSQVKGFESQRMDIVWVEDGFIGDREKHSEVPLTMKS